MFCSPSNPSSSASEVAIELVHLIGCSILLAAILFRRSCKDNTFGSFFFSPFFLLMMDHPTFFSYFPTFSINRSPTSALRKERKSFSRPIWRQKIPTKKTISHKKISCPFLYSRLREEAKELINSSTTKANRTQTDVTEKLGERIQVCKRFVVFL